MRPARLSPRFSLASPAAAADPASLWYRVTRLDWWLIGLIVALAGIGFAILYSAADGSWQPWAGKQALRFGIGMVMMIAVATISFTLWWRTAYLVYALALALLVMVEFTGVGEGSQRWISLGFMNLQPSETMKLALVLALARYFHDLDENQVDRIVVLIPPAVLTGIPALLVLRQPDLGTAMILVALAVAVTFLAGLAWWKFALGAALTAAAGPLAWRFLLHDYQRDRVLTFLDPGRDPHGAGYHILQSKIGLGSGGLFGKGFIGGTQSQLSFLPEKHTDFIFTLLAEEFGFFGSILLAAIIIGIIGCCYAIMMRCESVFARVLVLGLATNFFLYAFINMAMVMGLLPVVGVPLPLVSYGGTSMLTLLIGFGFIQSAAIHRGRLPLRHRGIS
ncbi:MAG: rod shape-determining protein RodA [Alphaproteobacteria bacterium]|nr:rod shape-determining protein RodA [Alphaproteobacteria bacterium]MCB9929648.1 rod shape-determining protein RodA [Alphaproteobacteria bacterium]